MRNPTFIVSLRDIEYYMGVDGQTAYMVLGIITAMLFDYKLSGVVQLIKDFGGHREVVIEENWEKGNHV